MKLSVCQSTDVEKVLGSYTCIMFEAAPEMVTRARWDAMLKYGERAAVKAMFPTNTSTEEGDE